MCARRRRLVIEAAAEADIGDILLYTRRQWGVEQRRRYRALLFRNIRHLVAHADLGVSRDELFPGCRMLPVGSHPIYYESTDGENLVIRVLH